MDGYPIILGRCTFFGLSICLPDLVKAYTFSTYRLGGDILAGLTVASMLIPQSVSYASSLAKLSPVTGLVRLHLIPHRLKIQ